jgi:hypothetical protein
MPIAQPLLLQRLPHPGNPTRPRVKAQPQVQPGPPLTIPIPKGKLLGQRRWWSGQVLDDSQLIAAAHAAGFIDPPQPWPDDWQPWLTALMARWSQGRGYAIIMVHTPP